MFLFLYGFILVGLNFGGAISAVGMIWENVIFSVLIFNWSKLNVVLLCEWSFLG